MFQPKGPPFYIHQHFVVFISCISVVFLLLHVIAFIAPGWGAYKITSLGISTSVNYGLWSTCASSGRTVCLDWTSNAMSSALIATRFFGVICVLSAIAAVVIFVLVAHKNTLKILKNTQKIEFIIADIVLFFVTAVLHFCTIISFVATIVKTGESDTISWSFYLVLVNILTSAAIGGYIIFYSVKTEIFPKKRIPVTNQNQLKQTKLNSPRKIKVIKIEEQPKIDEEEYQKYKEIIDSKII